MGHVTLPLARPLENRRSPLSRLLGWWGSAKQEAELAAELQHLERVLASRTDDYLMYCQAGIASRGTLLFSAILLLSLALFACQSPAEQVAHSAPASVERLDARWTRDQTAAHLRQWFVERADAAQEALSSCLAFPACQRLLITHENWERRSRATMQPQYLDTQIWIITMPVQLLTGIYRFDGTTTAVEEEWIIFENGQVWPSVSSSQVLLP